MMRTPLQIIVIRDLENRRTDAYVETLRLAFEGSVEATGSTIRYIEATIDLGIRVLEPAKDLNETEAELLISGSKHTVLVVIGEDSYEANLFERLIDSECIVRVESPKPQTPSETQAPKTSDGIEPALAPVVTALRTMQVSRYVLTKNTDTSGSDTLKLFISHAKHDGAATAKSLIGILKQLQQMTKESVNFSYFYDFDHLEAGMVWKEVLQLEAERSVMIALRTKEYENRYWCQQEFLWSESKGMPIVVVDLRISQYFDCASLPFDAIPTIRIHDGNLIRVILHAMSVHLRVLRVRSQVSKDVKVLPHRPSVYSLHGAIKAASKKTKKIAYPGPKLPQSYLQAVEPIMSCDGRRLELVTFDELQQ